MFEEDVCKLCEQPLISLSPHKAMPLGSVSKSLHDIRTYRFLHLSKLPEQVNSASIQRQLRVSVDRAGC